MNSAARSINIYGNYLVLLGIAFLVAPNQVLGVFQLPPTTEVWIRVVGMLVAYLGIYYRVAAAGNLVPFFTATVMLRCAVPIFFLGFVLAGWVTWPLLLFALPEVVGAAWTWSTLRSMQRTAG